MNIVEKTLSVLNIEITDIMATLIEDALMDAGFNVWVYINVELKKSKTFVVDIEIDEKIGDSDFNFKKTYSTTLNNMCFLEILVQDVKEALSKHK